MSEMVERVVKALDATRHLAIGASLTSKDHMAVWNVHTSECVADGFADDKAASDGLRAYRARSAIAAMRDPTEAMVGAGDGVHQAIGGVIIQTALKWDSDDRSGHWFVRFSYGDSAKSWRAMIDAAIGTP